jgi:hypothetical protein
MLHITIEDRDGVANWRNLGQPSRAWVNLLFEMGDKKKALKMSEAVE